MFKDYDVLVDEICDLICWCEEIGGVDILVGIGVVGLVNFKMGLVLIVNFCVDGCLFFVDIECVVGCVVFYINDCCVFVLFEVVFGVGWGYSIVMFLIFGIGIGGGVVYDWVLWFGLIMIGGEFGYCFVFVGLVVNYDLFVFECGCGCVGCIEIYIVGLGLVCLVKVMLGCDLILL